MDSYYSTNLKPSVKPSLSKYFYFTIQKKLSQLDKNLDMFGIPSLLLTYNQSIDIYTVTAFNIHCVFIQVFGFPFAYKNNLLHRLAISLVYYFCKNSIEIEFIRLRDTEFDSIVQQFSKP